MVSLEVDIETQYRPRGAWWSLCEVFVQMCPKLYTPTSYFELNTYRLKLATHRVNFSWLLKNRPQIWAMSVPLALPQPNIPRSNW